MWLHLLFHENRPGVDFSFLGGALPPGVTLARASSGTAFNSAGTLASYAADVPRFDTNPATLAPRGVLCEAQRQNLLLYSSDFSTWWVRVQCSFVGNVVSSPDGTVNAGTLTSAATGNARAEKANAAVTSGTTVSLSAFVKAGSANYAALGVHNGGGGAVAGNKFLLTGAGSVVTSVGGSVGSIKPVRGGWYSISSTFTTSTTTPYFYVAPDDGSNLVAGFPYSSAAGFSINVFGAQLEQATTVSSYIPTSGSAVTRAADQLSFIIPSGVSTLRMTFDDGSTQDVAVSAGTFTVPTNLSRSAITRIRSV